MWIPKIHHLMANTNRAGQLPYMMMAWLEKPGMWGTGGADPKVPSANSLGPGLVIPHAAAGVLSYVSSTFLLIQGTQRHAY